MTIQTASEYMAEASRLVKNPNATSNDLGRAKVLTSLAELAAAGDLDTDSKFKNFGLQRYVGDQTSSVAQLFNKYRARVIERTMDIATLRFFGGYRSTSYDNEAVISVSGGRIEEKRRGNAINGRGIGAVTELRDFSFAETRGLTEGVATDGGDTVPIGFVPQVFHAVKRTDELLGAANWDTAATANGEPLNIPSLSDTNTSAVTFAEAGVQLFQNPAFSQIKNDGTAFPLATNWTSKVVLASRQLVQDALPALSDTLGDTFRTRIARGFGAATVAAVVSDVAVGTTTASPTAITEKELLDLVASVDPGYGSAPGAGFAMAWGTLVYLLQNLNASATGGDAMYHIRRDAAGHFLLFGIPCFISNSMDSIGSNKKPVLYGDFSRLLIRNVPGDAVVRRYDETVC